MNRRDRSASQKKRFKRRPLEYLTISYQCAFGGCDCICGDLSTRTLRRPIEAEGIGPGEPFELCKVQVKTGQRRSIEWSVRRLNPEEVRVAVPAEAMEVPETQLESDLRASVDLINSKNGKEPAACANPAAS